MRLTLLDVARMAGVSRTTASRVLNGRGEVSPEVRARVEGIIAETGFRPLASARSLVSQRAGLIGFMLPLGVGAIFHDPYFSELLIGISQATAAKNLTVAMFLFDQEAKQDDLIERVIGPRRVDGLIMSAYHTQESLVDRLTEFDVPAVILGPSPYPDVFGSVAVDNFDGGVQAGKHLVGLGRKQIAMIAGPADTASGRDRSAGFRRALSDAGITLDDRLVRIGNFTRDDGFAKMQELLEFKPDAIFVAQDLMAAGAIDAITAAGLSLPSDIALVGFDGLRLSETTAPPMTTVRQPIAEVATVALDLLLNQIDDPRGIEHRVLPVDLIVRASSSPA